MPNKLFLKPTSYAFHSESEFEWAIYDVAGSLAKIGSRATLESIDQTMMQNGVENVEVILLWPSNLVLSTHVLVPGNQTRYIQQALPYLVEEQVAQDIEQLHLSLGQKQKNGEYTVVCTDYELFESAYNLINSELELGALKSVVLDADLLVVNDHDLAIFLASDGTSLVKTRDNLTIRLPSDSLVSYLDLALDESEDEKNAVLLVSDKADVNMLEAQLAQMESYEFETKPVSLSDMELLCGGYFSQMKDVTDLCQGDFKPVASTNSHWHKWKSVAAILVVGFLLQLGVFVGKGIHYQQEADAIGEQALAEYKKLVPSAKRLSVAKLPRIIKGKINQSKNQTVSDADFLTLLGEAGYQYSKAKNKTKLAFKSITYNEQRGELVLEMHAASFEQLDQLKQAIVDAGYTAKISSAVQEEQYYRGRINVGG